MSAKQLSYQRWVLCACRHNRFTWTPNNSLKLPDMGREREHSSNFLVLTPHKTAELQTVDRQYERTFGACVSCFSDQINFGHQVHRKTKGPSSPDQTTHLITPRLHRMLSIKRQNLFDREDKKRAKNTEGTPSGKELTIRTANTFKL